MKPLYYIINLMFNIIFKITYKYTNLEHIIKITYKHSCMETKKETSNRKSPSNFLKLKITLEKLHLLDMHLRKYRNQYTY